MVVTSFLLLSCLGLSITAQAQDCTKPVGGPHMSLKDEDILLEQFPVGSQVGFVCDVGYTFTGGSRTITCTANGWTRLAMRCERKNCGDFEKVENGNIDFSEGTEFGAKIVINCDPGYTLVGRGEIYCEDGGWNSRKPICEVVTCELPALVEHGSYSPIEDSYSYRAVVLYSCQRGFTLNGSKSVSCTADGTFQPAPPTCINVTCEPPAQVQHGSFSPDEESYSYRDVVQYSCQRDFALNGSKSVSCSGDGTFQPAPPTCIRVQCEEPVIKNAVWVSGSRPPYGHKATVTHRCDPGFKMIGQQTIVCELDSQWSPKLPICEPVTCAPLPNVEHGSFSPVKESYNYADVVQYSCQTGFTLSGSNSISCSDDGTFKPAPPTCTPVTCAPLPNVEHGSFSPDKESYNYADVVQYSCQTGFTLSGSNSISCSDDGTFKPAPPTCTRQD